MSSPDSQIPTQHPTGGVSLLEAIVRWVEKAQRRVLAEGMALRPGQWVDATAAGVRDPSRVRVLIVDAVPMPDDALVVTEARRLGLVSEHVTGQAAGYGIFLRKDVAEDRQTLVHELTHVAQYERLGSVEAFLRRFLEDCLTQGYVNSAMEREAWAVTRRVCATTPAGTPTPAGT